MFQFTGYRFDALFYSYTDNRALPLLGFPIRKSPDQRVFASPRSLSQLITSFIAYWCQGIHRTPLVAWSNSSCYISNIYKVYIRLLQLSNIIQLSKNTPPKRKNVCTRQSTFGRHFRSHISNFKSEIHFRSTKMVGVTGVEPVTSSLSGMRSNQLSYTPAF